MQKGAIMVKKEVCEIRKMFKDTDVPINPDLRLLCRRGKE